VLGLQLLSRNPGLAVLGPEGGPALVELHERLGARRVPRGGRLGLYHFAILLPDRASLGRFAGHLAAVGEYAGSADHIVSEALYLADPDGLGIEVYADRSRDEWAVSNREIVMATEPLDLRSLLRAGGGEPWSGMPRHTTIGHVHFHVGTIAEAERFYHVALGLDKVVWSYPGALFFSAGGYHHHVGTNTWADGASMSTPDAARLLEWELVLPGAADVSARGRECRGVGSRRSRRRRRPPRIRPVGHYRSLNPKE